MYGLLVVTLLLLFAVVGYAAATRRRLRVKRHRCRFLEIDADIVRQKLEGARQENHRLLEQLDSIVSVEETRTVDAYKLQMSDLTRLEFIRRHARSITWELADQLLEMKAIKAELEDSPRLENPRIRIRARVMLPEPRGIQSVINGEPSSKRAAERRGQMV